MVQSWERTESYCRADEKTFCKEETGEESNEEDYEEKNSKEESSNKKETCEKENFKKEDTETKKVAGNNFDKKLRSKI